MVFINFSCHALSLSATSAYSFVITQLMSYHTEVHVVFIFIVPLIFIAPTPPPFNFSVANLVKVCMKILLLPYSLLHMNGIRGVVYHKTSPKEGRHWIFFCPESFKKTIIVFLPYTGDVLWGVSSLPCVFNLLAFI